MQSPLTVLPPVQRIEPGKPSGEDPGFAGGEDAAAGQGNAVLLQPAEIPPKSNKPNSLQIALQTRIKLFYRPAAIAPERNAAPWQEQLTLTKQGTNTSSITRRRTTSLSLMPRRAKAWKAPRVRAVYGAAEGADTVDGERLQRRR
ncbi:fimbria/pilus periplasmic chaperone [Serratia ureilytica]